MCNSFWWDDSKSGDPHIRSYDFAVDFAVAIWTCYWMWRIGRDVIGKGGFLAAALLGCR